MTHKRTTYSLGAHVETVNDRGLDIKSFHKPNFPFFTFTFQKSLWDGEIAVAIFRKYCLPQKGK